MTFKPSTWYPIAVAVTVLNLVGLGWAVREPAEPLHAAAHVALALAFGLWARRLRQGGGGSEQQARLETSDTLEALEALETEVGRLRQELSETQERLDFTERVLARGPDARRGSPQG